MFCKRMGIPSLRLSAHRLHVVVPVALWFLAGCAATTDAVGERQLSSEDLTAETKIAEARDRLLELGRQALAARDYRDAYVNYSRLLNVDKTSPEAWIGLGESYLGAGNLPKAAATFKKAADFPSVEALALQGKGLTMMLLGQQEAGKTALLAALEIDASQWRSWNGLGQYYDLAANWPKAAEAYAQALRLDPQVAEVRNNLGVSLLMQGRYEDASAAFEKALELEPGLIQARENRRLALAFLGRYIEATKGIPHKDQEKALNNVGYVAMQRQDYSAAESFLNDAMQNSAAYYGTAAENLEELKFRRQLGKGDAKPD